MVAAAVTLGDVVVVVVAAAGAVADDYAVVGGELVVGVLAVAVVVDAAAVVVVVAAAAVGVVAVVGGVAAVDVPQLSDAEHEQQPMKDADGRQMDLELQPESYLARTYSTVIHDSRAVELAAAEADHRVPSDEYEPAHLEMALVGNMDSVRERYPTGHNPVCWILRLQLHCC